MRRRSRLTEQAVLKGIRILDFSRAMAGPYGTMVMADFGADVIRVEGLDAGEGVISDRGSGVTLINGESPMFMTYNRNKRSLCIDLRNPESQAIVDRLIGRADILIQNFRPAVADQMGIGWERSSKLNPRLIYVSINGFGSKGPWKDRPGIDVVLQALSGVMSVTGESDGEPVLSGVPVADFSTAMISVQGMLLALINRSITGRGQHVEVPMLAVCLMSLAHQLGPYFATGINPTRRGSQHSQYVPFQAFKTKDGYGIGGVVREKHWHPFCQIVGINELADDPRYARNLDRVARRDELIGLVAPHFLERTTAEWESAFGAASIAFGAVNSFSDSLESEQARANDMITSIKHPVAGDFRMVAPVLRLSESPAAVTRPSPLLGEHSRDVLADFGFEPTEIDELMANGIVRTGEVSTA
jgi:formyl-CoA transferase/CoA:oxalate CoA-transferase